MIKNSVIGWLAAIALVGGYALLTRPVGAPSPSPARTALESARVSVSIHQEDLRDAVAKLGLAAGVEIRVASGVDAWEPLSVIGVNLRDVPLRRVLAIVTTQACPDQDIAVSISEDERAIVIGPSMTTARVYDVGTLVAAEAAFHERWMAAGGDASGGAETRAVLLGMGLTSPPRWPTTPGMPCNIEPALTISVEPHSWTSVGGREGAMRIFGGRMAVVHGAQAHAKMGAALARLSDVARQGTNVQSEERHPSTVRGVRDDDVEGFLVFDPYTLTAGQLTTEPKAGSGRAAQLSKLIASVECDRQPAEQVIAYLRDVSGVNVYVDWRAVEATGLERQAPVTLSLRQVSVRDAFSILLSELCGSNVALGWRWEDNVLTITDERVLSRATMARVYDVRDLLVDAMRFGKAFEMRAAEGLPPADLNAARGATTLPASRSGGFWSSVPPAAGSRSEEAMAEGLRDVIKETVRCLSWIDNGGRAASVQYCAGRLIIVQTPEAHREIEALLKSLRR